MAEQLLHYLSYANQTLLQSIPLVNIRGNDDARCKYFLQRKDGFWSPSVSQTVVNKRMRIRKKEIKAMLANTNPLPRFLFLPFEAGPDLS